MTVTKSRHHLEKQMRGSRTDYEKESSSNSKCASMRAALVVAMSLRTTTYNITMTSSNRSGMGKTAKAGKTVAGRDTSLKWVTSVAGGYLSVSERPPGK